MKFTEIDTHEVVGTVILDIDGTLTPDGGEMVSGAVTDKVIDIAKEHQVYLSTNKKLPARNEAFSRSLNIPLLNNAYRKPDTRSIAEIPPERRNKLTVIGDKYITDGLLAKRLGAHFIKVERVRSVSESFIVKLTYLIDDILFFICGR